LSSTDLSELEKFDGRAPSWWDRDGEFRTLHDINPLRVRFIANRCDVRGQNIVDVGCGGGILSESLAFLGGRVTGIDPAKGPLVVAKLHSIESGVEQRIEYIHGTAEELTDDKRESFDVVTALEILEHVSDYNQVIQSLADLCKPGGNVFISTINRTWQAYLMAILGAEYVLGLLPRGTHDYQKLLRPSEIANAMRSAGLIVKEVAGYTYNPFTRYAFHCDSVDVNFLMHACKPT